MISQMGRVRKVVCAYVSVLLAVRTVEVPVFFCLCSSGYHGGFMKNDGDFVDIMLL